MRPKPNNRGKVKGNGKEKAVIEPKPPTKRQLRVLKNRKPTFTFYADDPKLTYLRTQSRTQNSFHFLSKYIL